jgi:hypothetical protein
LINLKIKQIQKDFPSLSEKEKELYYAKNQAFITNFENFCVDYYAQKPAIAGDLFNLRRTAIHLSLSITSPLAD